MKTVWILFGLVVICSTSLGVFYDRLEQSFLPQTSGLTVLGMPEDLNVKPLLASYQGDHPRMITRPSETFSFPIPIGQTGPVVPLFAGENQYPFVCDTQQSDLGQPLVDNQARLGIKVYEPSSDQPRKDDVIGYSKDCSLKTQIQYYIKDETQTGFIQVNDLSAVSQAKQIIRIETGTINRFIYVLALPVNKQDRPVAFNDSKWNQKLIYRFKGGVGVGRKQGHVNINRLLYEHEGQLEQGYAVAFSTGTQTSNHYNIWLSEDTALRVKKQFSSRYGEPLYTIGIGGSGGAIQQYLLAQNHPGIIDAAIPLYSYPDMVTQVNYALDCELLEYYFDETSNDPLWKDWPSRVMVQGSNAINGFKNKYGRLQGIAAMFNGNFSKMPTGASECTNGWRGPAHLINNPKFFSDYHEIAPSLMAKVDWSHWGDLYNIYGTDEHGLGKRFWENDGVQYGLQALKEGELSVAAFIELNRNVGGWKQTKDMQNEFFWHISGDDSFKRLSLWSQQNMTHDGNKVLASRTQGDAQAAMAAYQAGLVFLGFANLPIIDLRHYLDHKLDMHHSMASFTSRQRINYAMGDSRHQLIWMMERDDTLSKREAIRNLPINDALRVLDQWIFNIRANPNQSVADNRPDVARDRCYDKDHNIIDDGDTTWDGQWNQKQSGVCQSRFPHFTHSRMVAGESIYSDTLMCEKMPVRQAIEFGVYGELDMWEYLSQLEGIFPNGVCYYPKGPNPQMSLMVSKLQNKDKPVAAIK